MCGVCIEMVSIFCLLDTVAAFSILRCQHSDIPFHLKCDWFCNMWIVAFICVWNSTFMRTNNSNSLSNLCIYVDKWPNIWNCVWFYGLNDMRFRYLYNWGDQNPCKLYCRQEWSITRQTTNDYKLFLAKHRQHSRSLFFYPPPAHRHHREETTHPHAHPANRDLIRRGSLYINATHTFHPNYLVTEYQVHTTIRQRENTHGNETWYTRVRLKYLCLVT